MSLGTRVDLNEVDEEIELTVRYNHVNKKFGTQQKTGVVDNVERSDDEIQSVRLRENESKKIYKLTTTFIKILEGQTIGHVIDFRLPDVEYDFTVPDYVEAGSTVKITYTPWGDSGTEQDMFTVSGTRGSTLLLDMNDGTGRVTVTGQLYDQNGVKIGEKVVVSKPEIEQ